LEQDPQLDLDDRSVPYYLRRQREPKKPPVKKRRAGSLPQIARSAPPHRLRGLGLWNTILGALLLAVFLVGGVLMILGLEYALGPSGAKTPTGKMIAELHKQIPGLVAYLLLSFVLELALFGLLLVSGIGLLKLQAWARPLSVVYAVGALVLLVVGLLFQFLVLNPAMDVVRQKAYLGTGVNLGRGIAVDPRTGKAVNPAEPSSALWDTIIVLVLSGLLALHAVIILNMVAGSRRVSVRDEEEGSQGAVRELGPPEAS
jgi:hypothetical protein